MQLPFDPLMGMRVFVGQHKPVYRLRRMCRSKKKRIRNKWIKNRRNWVFDKYERWLYRAGDSWYMDPVTYQQFEREISKRNELLTAERNHET